MATIKERIDGVTENVTDGKQDIASAITDKGVSTSSSATFSTMADNIRAIEAGAGHVICDAFDDGWSYYDGKNLTQAQVDAFTSAEQAYADGKIMVQKSTYDVMDCTPIAFQISDDRSVNSVLKFTYTGIEILETENLSTSGTWMYNFIRANQIQSQDYKCYVQCFSGEGNYLNIASDGGKQFIRLYKSTETDSQLKIVSGMNVVIDDKLYKHMLHNFIYLKEAMFSKCIIFVEGDTENGAIPVFAERMGLDMDERGIGVIKLDGADSVKRCMALYKSFGIKSIALIDKDKKESYSSEPDIYFTKANDYEEDVYDNFKLTDYLKSCKELSGVEPYIPILRREGLNFNPGQFVENPANIEIDDTLQMKIMVENKDRELQKLKQSKNAAKGAVLAGYVTVIPPAFEKIINKLIKEVK